MLTIDGLAGRSALVTGGFGGIGAATVAALLANGANVTLTRLPGRERLDRAIQERWGERLHIVEMELRDLGSIEACVGAAAGRWGRIDILVNNAAVGSATVAAVATDEAAQDSAMLAINADGTLKMCQAFLRHAAADASGYRTLVNLSSVGGGVSQFSGFRLSDGMSKAAIAHLTRQLAAELAHSPIDVMAVCPGATDTPMLRASTLDAMAVDEREAFEARLPKGRLIQPEEIADVIVFLVSPAGRVLHGAVIDASMGLGVRPGLMTD